MVVQFATAVSFQRMDDTFTGCGRKVQMELQYYDRSSFLLVQSRFRWVQDYPFNR
jgi:hypothetical protein